MKERLRKELKNKRNSLSKNEVLEKSKKIKERLYALNEFKQAPVIVFYVSYDNEVFTHDIIKECLTKKEVIIPKSVKENRSLILSKLENWNDLEIGAYNILEPREDKIIEISIDEIDLIIVPGVGFDEKGRRIGHGKGYYDILMKKSIKALHIGLAFECQMVEQIPTEEHDVPVDIIVTEKRVLDFNKQ